MACTFSSKGEIVERLRKQIAEKDSTAIHTLMFVFANQTEDEQRHEMVKYHNGVGFVARDAEIGSNFAKWYKEKGFFTAKQLAAVKKMVRKYAGQVVSLKIFSGEIKKIGNVWVWG